MFTRQPSPHLLVSMNLLECHSVNTLECHLVNTAQTSDIDDVLIASATPEEHLCITLSRLKMYGIIINPTKCILGVFSLHFLGHLVDNQGICP